MPEFTVRYWFGDDAHAGQNAAYVSSGLAAESDDDAARTVQEQMRLPVFAVDSDGYGRVVINSAQVRFCSILPARTAGEAAIAADAQVVAQAVADFAARAQAAGVVDNDTRR